MWVVDAFPLAASACKPVTAVRLSLIRLVVLRLSVVCAVRVRSPAGLRMSLISQVGLRHYQTECVVVACTTLRMSLNRQRVWRPMDSSIGSRLDIRVRL